MENNTRDLEFLRFKHRHGFEVPAAVLDRDVTEDWVLHPDLVHTFRGIYKDKTEYWTVDAACEER
ncbi:hypothetical protein [Cryobacterium sp. SO1]|uniref:hypothetical protein n=1 Tax=Cryobacterium sp. SO1 TaxID=1897061 RepID=UPI00210BBF60|nr:hypothetical protein [Cryobacterium sp. SO1]